MTDNNLGLTNSIEKTQDLTRFRMEDENRDISPQALERLMERIREKNLLHLYPAIVVGDDLIRDGQHRLEAAKALQAEGLDIWFYYIHVDDEDAVTLEDIAMTNAAVLKWEAKDYLKLYAKRGYKHYVTLTAFLEAYPWMTVTSAVQLLTGRQGKFSASARKEFQDGEFVVETEARFFAVVQLVECAVSGGFTKATQLLCVAALAILLDYKADFDRLFDKIAKYPDLLSSRATLSGYVNMLVNLYNYNERRRMSVPSLYVLE
jgi:hypothetical protein